MAGVATVVADRFASILPEVPHQRSVFSIRSKPHRMDRLQVCLTVRPPIVSDFSTAKSSVASVPFVLKILQGFCGLVGWIDRWMGGTVNRH